MDASRLQSLIEELIEERGEDSIRELVRRSKEQNGITQRDLATAAHISLDTLGRWEAGQVRLSVQCLAKFWIALSRLRLARSKGITAA